MASSTPREALPAVGWSFLRSPRWLGYYAMLIVFSVVCVLLGNWQFDRRAEARAEIARIDNNYDASAVALREEIPDPASFDEDAQKWQTVAVSGTYVGDPVLVRNRPGPDGVGSDVLQALLTDEGLVFWVDRGWVPVDGQEASGDVAAWDEVPAAPAGEVQVVARLRASEPVIDGRSSAGRTLGSINAEQLTELAAVTETTYTAAYGMLVSESPEAEHGVLPDKPERDEGPHLSYALQWYIFIAIALIGVGYAATREYRNLNPESEAVERQDRTREERRRRRGPSDAEEEDALLDAPR